MKLSVIIPFYNEQDNVAKLISATTEQLKGVDYELILVDDGSNDNTVKNAMSMLTSSIQLLVLDQNYGQSIALKAGLDSSKGELIAFMDGDLQNNPSDILKMLVFLETSDAVMIQGYRKFRQDTFSKKISSILANLIIRVLFNTKLHDVGCSIKIFRRELISNIQFFKGFHRFLPLITAINGFKVEETEVHHSARESGKSKYGISRVFSVLNHLIKLRFRRQLLAESLTYKIKEKH